MSDERQDSPRTDNRFEQYPKTTIAVVLLVIAGLIELAAYFAVRTPGFYMEYNRKVSGYTVFQNNPKHQLVTQKRNASAPDATLDQYGFLAGGPVTLEKPPGTVRIFVMGGSAAFGADQNGNYRDLYEYPWGIYTFADSIAGQLQAQLEARQPGTRFEVITAAAFTRAYHQSVIHYLELISRFSPDWIVAMDGYNDVNHLVSGTPYADRAGELQYYIDLDSGAKCLTSRMPNTVCLLDGIARRLSRSLFRPTHFPAPPYTADFDLDRYTEEQYLQRKQHFVSASERFVQTLRHEMGVLRADGVNFLFVLQPMLHRQGWNKPLSPREQLFQRGVAPPLYPPDSVRDTTEPPAFTDAMLLLKYFFDDYLSPVLEDEIRAAEFHYLDMNQAVENVPASVEFYTDYCHLTEEGNRLVAEAIGDKILSASVPVGRR